MSFVCTVNALKEIKNVTQDVSLIISYFGLFKETDTQFK